MARTCASEGRGSALHLAPRSPERTCIGCRKVAGRKQLLRIVVEETDGQQPLARWDLAASAPGRGAWVHNDPTCVELAQSRGNLARAFRRAVDPAGLAERPDISEGTSESW
ncbi:YlxR family protein [Dermabacteraceae bacterium P13115]